MFILYTALYHSFYVCSGFVFSISICAPLIIWTEDLSIAALDELLYLVRIICFWMLLKVTDAYKKETNL